MDLKICSRCLGAFPLLNFRKNPARSAGRNDTCKPCDKIVKEEKLVSKGLKNKVYAEISKICTGCNLDKPLEEFDALSKGRLGRKSQCKECTRTYNLSYNEKNADILAKNQQEVQRLTRIYNLGNLATIYSEEVLNQKRQCSRCQGGKFLLDFHRSICAVGGFHSHCLECSSNDTRTRYQGDDKYRLRSIERSKKRNKTDPERIKRKERRALEKVERSEKYRAQIKETQKIRIARIKQATPVWSDKKKIRDIYNEAKRLSKLTGVKHTVDHHYPLAGKTVCGLHVPENLPILPLLENLKKGTSEVDTEWVIHNSSSNRRD